jgi:UDP-N-acetylmuramate: L-alanyl-gamma-D-glutamyl-meso-diaminopimelate ligase
LYIADKVVIADLFHPERYTAETAISPKEMVETLRSLGREADFIPVVDQIVEHLTPRLGDRDVVVIMSNGSFGGIHAKLIAALERSRATESSR